MRAPSGYPVYPREAADTPIPCDYAVAVAVCDAAAKKTVAHEAADTVISTNRAVAVAVGDVAAPRVGAHQTADVIVTHNVSTLGVAVVDYTPIHVPNQRTNQIFCPRVNIRVNQS